MKLLTLLYACWAFTSLVMISANPYSVARVGAEMQLGVVTSLYAGVMVFTREIRNK
jgi:hypothetical protein